MLALKSDFFILCKSMLSISALRICGSAFLKSLLNSPSLQMSKNSLLKRSNSVLLTSGAWHPIFAWLNKNKVDE